MMNHVYTVGQISTYITNMFKQDYMLEHIYVKGEVSNCTYHGSGHIYFTLKEKNEVLSGVMYKNFKASGLKFPMKTGDQVIALGKIIAYPGQGKYEIVAEQIQLEGAGDLYGEFLKLKQELEEMGMFAQEYKRPIPKYIKTLGVVTAATGAAIQDIRNITARRNPYVQLVLCPALVQGEGAVESIVRGIYRLEDYGVDAIIVGRGGGSMEDLWAFNSVEVARAIFDCNTPIISAVGHETDVTIADYVADLRAPTPSAAAELAVYQIQDLMELLSGYETKLKREMDYRLDIYRQRMRSYESRLKALSPQNQLELKRHRAKEAEGRLKTLMDRKYSDYRHRIGLYAERMEGLSPLKRISDGYAYVADDSGKRIRRAADARKGDRVSLQFQDGRVITQVTDVRLEDI